MPEKSEGNNHTSKINVFPDQKMDLFAPHGVIKSTLWPASRKMNFQNIEEFLTLFWRFWTEWKIL